jgi:hypothetical protein
MTKRIKRNYVNNQDFLNALIEYKKKCKEAEDSGEQLPKVPNYIGACIFQIANRLATKPNFSGYTYKEDMIMDGIENCLLYINNFDHEKSSNPFAYFTQVIWFAFLRRIAKEKKQLYVKYKSSHETIMMGDTFEGGGEIHLHLNTSADYINSFIEDYETKLGKNKGTIKLEDNTEKKE